MEAPARNAGGFCFITMTERRRTPRRRTLKAGIIIFNNGGGLSCMVRNLSPAGACIEVESPQGIPDAFTLVIESDNLMRRCHIGWRNEKRIGVAFN
jgi:hypothetical protein